MSTVAYLTLTDGTLVDLEQDDANAQLTISAGQSLDRAKRPVVLTLTAADARQVILHLTAFIINHDTSHDHDAPPIGWTPLGRWRTPINPREGDD